MMFVSILCLAQNELNTNKIYAFVICEQNKDGFWICHKDTVIEKKEATNKFYAYDKKNCKLYGISLWGNYVYFCSKDFHKKLRKDIPILKEKAILPLIELYNQELIQKAEIANKKRIQEIEEEKRIAIIKAKEDSIKREEQDREHERKKAEYIRTHNKHYLPKNKVLKCLLCDEYNREDSVYTAFFKNDTLYYVGTKNGLLGYRYQQIHVAKVDIPSMDEKFKLHYEAFKDSLIQTDDYFNLKTAQQYNDIQVRECAEKVVKKAPNGFIDYWDWDCEYGMVTLKMRYCNLNQKTIKYIDVYFSVKNDVGDVRGSGHFQGTGPVEFMSSGTWNWDSSRYYVARDASKMALTKIILTYMNGQKVTINKNRLVFNKSSY